MQDEARTWSSVKGYTNRFLYEIRYEEKKISGKGREDSP